MGEEDKVPANVCNERHRHLDKELASMQEAVKEVTKEIQKQRIMDKELQTTMQLLVERMDRFVSAVIGIFTAVFLGAIGTAVWFLQNK